MPNAAQGATTPNPMVGAVVVSPDGVVVGQGRHPRAGDPHAEVFALDDAGERARGATLYVTLEPCNHQGRTGPCTRRIIHAGVARVVAAMADPNPRVNGSGFAELRAHGIVVETGVLEAEAARLNRAFVTVADAGPADGDRQSGDEPRFPDRRGPGRAHAADLAPGESADAALAGGRRCHRGRVGHRARRRPGVDRARLLSGAAAGPRDFRSPAADTRDRPGLLNPRRRTDNNSDDGGRDRPPTRTRSITRGGGRHAHRGTGDLGADLRRLLSWDISTLLLEGGGAIHAAAWTAGVVDRVHVIVAPTVLGDRGVKFFDGLPVPLSQLIPVRVETLGPDAWMEADVHGHR